MLPNCSLKKQIEIHALIQLLIPIVMIGKPMMMMITKMMMTETVTGIRPDATEDVSAVPHHDLEDCSPAKDGGDD